MENLIGLVIFAAVVWTIVRKRQGKPVIPKGTFGGGGRNEPADKDLH